MGKNILIVQNYNINKGDTSVVHAMKYSLEEYYNDIKIFLTSYDPEKAMKEYHVESAHWLIDYSRIKKAPNGLYKIFYFLEEILWVIYSWIWVKLFTFNLSNLKFIPVNRRKTIQLYLNADVVVLPGGHFFTTLNKFPVVFSHYYSMWFAHKLKKKTMIYAQTIGPFKGFWSKIVRLITGKAINFCDKITVREGSSLRYDKNKKMILTGEVVFLNKNVERKMFLKKENDKLIGITIHHIYYSQYYSREGYIALMGEILTKIIDEYGYNILFIPMESFRNKEVGDRLIIGEIKKFINREDKTKVVEDDLTPEETESLISSVEIFIGTKTHSIVYALKKCVPTIAIAYQEKSTEFMKAFNVPENSIELAKLNVSDFMTIFNNVINNLNKYKSVQRNALEKVIEKAELNNEVLYELIK
ncbi:polysaccharide pyruvyl transferase family protein [Thermophagus sp. OGC60D27]|uniref:polysaccharide pyruvyl transferase family protein n=1 Tax=Thermophagus sp. OGC60D27 TaxID=3458415 RepID=UPI004037D878